MKYITPITAFLVLLISAAGFALSYQALHEYAIENGISHNLAWLWPLIIDGFMLVISVSILWASLNKQATWQLWGMAIIATAISITFNIAHAPANFWGRAVATVAPVAMFAAFEVFIKQIRYSVVQKTALESLVDIQRQVRDKEGQLSDVEKKIETRQTKQVDIESQVKDTRITLRDTLKEIEAARVELANIRDDIQYTSEERPDRLTERRDIVKLLHTYNVPLPDIANYFAVNPKTIQRDLDYTKAQQNGHSKEKVN